MKIIYAGTPEFAIPALDALLKANYQIVAVYTQPDRPAGRGKQIMQSPVKQFALTHHIPVEQPQNFKDECIIKKLAAYQADIMIVAAYGLILPQAVLDLFPYGCINIHASILPRWRGAAPIQRAIIAGDSETGVSIMQMEKGLDTGPYFWIEKCLIEKSDTGQSLHNRLAELGAITLIKILPKIFAKEIHTTSQTNEFATYAHRLEKSEAQIDWSESSELIQQKIRAYNPWPVAFCKINQENIRILQAEYQHNSTTQSNPGCVVRTDKQGIYVACGKGELIIKQLQFPGGKILSAAEVLNAKRELFIPGLQLC